MRKYLIALSTAFVALLAVSQAGMAANAPQMSEETHKSCGDWGFGTTKDCE